MLSLKRSAFIFWCIIFFCSAVHCQEKLSPHIKNNVFKIVPEKTPFSVSVHNARLFEKQYDGKVTILHQSNSTYYTLTLKNNDVLEELKNDSNIVFIDSHHSPTSESDFEYSNLAFNRINKIHHNAPTLSGASSKVSIKELAFDPLNIDLLKRNFTTSVSPTASSQHATNMAILIAGSGNSSYHTRGVANQATLTSSDFAVLFPDNPSIFNSNNINIQNHSYGVGIENYYGNEAAAYDQQVYQYPNQLHVFSAGNIGTSKPSTGIYQNLSFANLSGNFKQAKNVLIVNAVDTTLNINSFNSRGPAFDGRVKPELTAYGQGGTSDAAALVSGISTLIHEKYALVTQQIPDAAMTKAILIASADDLGSDGIDYLYGYGNVNAEKAMALVEAHQTLVVNLVSNQQLSLPISIPANVGEIKIAIVWNDPPALVNSTSVLINDIESWVDFNSTTILPWVLSSYPNIDSLRALPKRKKDHLNNVEYITLANPTPGSITLHVKSGILTGASQSVSISYSFQSNQAFTWNFPQVNDALEGGKKNLLVWEAVKDAKGNLYLSVDGGVWQLINSDIDLNHYTYWTCPNILAVAKLKMVVGAQEFVTDEFVISPLLKLNTAFVCADQIGLTWNKINGATRYEVYTMGDQLLAKIMTSTDTLLTFTPTSNYFYAVAPRLNNRNGLKSDLINYTQQGVFCYINLFTVKRFNSNIIKTNLVLSSWYGIKHISIYKTVGGLTTLYKNINPAQSLSIEFDDTSLSPGIMSYQAEITFESGTKLLSEIAQVIVEETGNALLYPNPVSSNQDLTFLTEGGGIKLRIVDLLGKVIFEKVLQNVNESIDVINLTNGLYLYQLFSSTGVFTGGGKFIKQ